MPELFVLYEHAAGYGLFTVKEFEEVGMLLPQVEQSVTDLKRFNQIVKLTAFTAFKSAVVALENINSISEGIISDTLQVFLEQNVPKKNKIQLGVSDPKLAATISETLGIHCLSSGAVPEIIRGIRYHFSKLVKGFNEKSSDVAQLGLGHSYSRAKVKFNIHKNDNMIIQSICLLDQLDKDINIFAMRIKEWYSYHFPELCKIVPELYLYAKCVRYIKNRKELDETKIDELEEILMDRSKAEAVYEASKMSMGMDISPVDLMNIELFASRVISLSEYRSKLSVYLHDKMEGIAPNLATLVGDQVGARLISHAGSLTNLAKFPASTVQILGAEKALFRALKMRSVKTPKYGLLYHSSFIAKAESKNKGRISRFLANKCTIASRIDCFSDITSSIYGEKLKNQVEERLNYYQTGDLPEKNINVMLEAAQALQEAQLKKKKKKSKKRKLENGLPDEKEPDFNPPEALEESKIEPDADEQNTEAPVQKKKKKKKKNKEKLENGE